MAHARSGIPRDGAHPALKGLSTQIPRTDDGLIPSARNYQVSDSKQVLPLPNEQASSKPRFIKALCCYVPLRFLNSTLAVLTVICNVAMNVTLPIYADALIKAGGDPYDVLVMSAIFFPLIFFSFLFGSKLICDRKQKLFPAGNFKTAVLVGFLTAVNGLLIVFASPAERTPPYLQGILTTTMVPFTVIFRYMVLRKGVSFPRLACTGIVIVGLFITIEPQIWNLQGSGSSSGNGGQSGLGRVLWPMCFALGFLPAALLNVYIEKATKHGEAESMVFITWIQLFQGVFVALGFWADFIPGFGNVDSAATFAAKTKAALTCQFSSAPTCHGVAFKSWLFIISYCTANLFSFLLIQYAEGAVYAVVVQALVTPIATLFWTIFKPSPSFHWDPEFTMTTGFTLVGLAVISPAVVMYNYFSRKEGATESPIIQEA